MKVGRVLRFTSDQAIGHELRQKRHIFVGKTADHRAEAEYAFLFISSSNYGQCLPILQADYPKILTHDSFISCSGLVFYSKEFLLDAEIEPMGDIAPSLLVALRGHLIDHDIMPGWQIKVACAALPAVL